MWSAKLVKSKLWTLHLRDHKKVKNLRELHKVTLHKIKYWLLALVLFIKVFIIARGRVDYKTNVSLETIIGKFSLCKKVTLFNWRNTKRFLLFFWNFYLVKITASNSSRMVVESQQGIGFWILASVVKFYLKVVQKGLAKLGQDPLDFSLLATFIPRYGNSPSRIFINSPPHMETEHSTTDRNNGPRWQSFQQIVGILPQERNWDNVLLTRRVNNSTKIFLFLYQFWPPSYTQQNE